MLTGEVQDGVVVVAQVGKIVQMGPGFQLRLEHWQVALSRGVKKGFLGLFRDLNEVLE